MNDKITAFAKQNKFASIISVVTNNKNEQVFKNHSYNPFQSFSSFPSVSTFVLAVSLILSSNYLSAYFNVSLCLAADASVCILINLVTQLLSD